jgi:hypothetical protein
LNFVLDFVLSKFCTLYRQPSLGDESWIKDEIEVKKQGDFIDFSIVKKNNEK